MTNIGAFGRQAAATYQQVSPERRAQTPVQYTPDFQAKGASMDLFAYADSFDLNKDGQFSANEIFAASGLNPQKLSTPQEIETLWDLNKDNKVDLKEAFVGLGHLDFSDGAADGRITQEGRQYVENAFFGYPAAEKLRQGEIYRQQKEMILGPSADDRLNAFIQSLPDEQVRTTLEQLAKEPGMRPVFDETLSNMNTRDTFIQQRESLIQKQIKEAHQGYQDQLQQVTQARDADRRYQQYIQGR